MDITLEQARVFESVVRLGTVQKAATELNRGHSAVLYSLKGLEDQTGLKLFDRSGHRNRLSREGELVFKLCIKLLDARHELIEACAKIRNGWEPTLKLIYDEVVDFDFIGDALLHLQQMTPTTEIKVLSAHLGDVEALFASERADIMVTVSPLRQLQSPSRKLSPLHMKLVAHRNHPLFKNERRKATVDDLLQQTFVTIQSAATQLGLSTDGFQFKSSVLVNDFTSKRLVIKKGLGFGWLPDYLIASDLKSGSLKVLNAEIDTTLKLRPVLYHRSEDRLGRAARELLRSLQATRPLTDTPKSSPRLA